jgi:hypothetical protein
MDKKTIFMTILYIVILVMMFIHIGILIYRGKSPDKNIAYAFFGFSILISLLCILSLIKSDSKSKLIKLGMGVSTFLMFGFLIASVVLSKPDSEYYFQMLTYSNMILLFIVNVYATIMVIGTPAIEPTFDNSAF